MRTIKGIAQNQPDPGSARRLKSYRNGLLKRRPAKVFDDRARDVLLQYAWNPELVKSWVQYLDGLTKDGVPFCRSWFDYPTMRDRFLAYAQPEPSDFRWNQHFQCAVEELKRFYSRAQLKPKRYQSDTEIREDLSNLSASTGYERIESGISKKGEVFDRKDVMKKFQEIGHYGMQNGTFNRPILMHYRTQGSGEFLEDGTPSDTFKVTTRPVFMVDFWTILHEQRFAVPAIGWLSKQHNVKVGKSDQVTWRWMAQMRRQSQYWVSLDYSRYDSSVPSWLLRAAFEVLSSAFTMDDEDKAIFLAVQNDFINKVFITPEGELRVTKGTPSGSALTTVIGSICHEIILRTVASRFDFKIVGYQVNNDDGIIFTKKKIPLDEIADYVSKRFGIKTNSDKTAYGRSDNNAPKYLSREWRWDGPWRNPQELVSRLVFPEKFRDYREEVLTPELVVWSYVLGYETSMRRLMDVDRFCFDYGFDGPIDERILQASSWLSYNIVTALTASPAA